MAHPPPGMWGPGPPGMGGPGGPPPPGPHHAAQQWGGYGYGSNSRGAGNYMGGPGPDGIHGPGMGGPMGAMPPDPYKPPSFNKRNSNGFQVSCGPVVSGRCWPAARWMRPALLLLPLYARQLLGGVYS